MLKLTVYKAEGDLWGYKLESHTEVIIYQDDFKTAKEALAKGRDIGQSTVNQLMRLFQQ